MYWHGYPGTFDEYIRLKVIDRLLANDALSEWVKRSNATGSSRPKDDR